MEQIQKIVKIKQAVECEVSPNEKHSFTTSTTCDHCGRGAVIVNGEVLYVPSIKQNEYHQSTAKNTLFYGGRGSGKSVCGRWDAHMRALSVPGFKYCILRRTYPELEKSHLIDLPREMKLLGGDWNATSKIARYPNGSTGFFSHCQNDQDALNLLSSEFHLMFFDEISTFDWEMFRKLAASVRAPEKMRALGVNPMVRAATNPLGASAEMINKYWVAQDVDLDEDPNYNPKHWYAIKANLEDNPYLSEDYREQFSGMASHIIKAWVEGEFSIENALFDLRHYYVNEAGEKKPWHVINDLDLPKIIRSAAIYRSIDAGWFPDPTVVLWIAHLGNRHIVFNEMIKWKTPAVEMAELIKKEDERLGISKVAMTYCDPSMDINTTADIRTIREVYEANGISIECSINDREMFATAIHQSLAEQAGENLPRIQFYVQGRKGCPYLVRTLPQMRFHPKQFKKMDDHKDDHAVVALAYYLMSHSADSRVDVNYGRQVPKWMLPKNRCMHGRAVERCPKCSWNK
jgi:hypothetical protein